MTWCRPPCPGSRRFAPRHNLQGMRPPDRGGPGRLIQLRNTTIPGESPGPDAAAGRDTQPVVHHLHVRYGAEGHAHTAGKQRVRDRESLAKTNAKEMTRMGTTSLNALAEACHEPPVPPADCVLGVYWPVSFTAGCVCSSRLATRIMMSPRRLPPVARRPAGRRVSSARSPGPVRHLDRPAAAGNSGDREHGEVFPAPANSRPGRIFFHRVPGRMSASAASRA
jgi:hypothetical protein